MIEPGWLVEIGERVRFDFIDSSLEGTLLFAPHTNTTHEYWVVVDDARNIWYISEFECMQILNRKYKGELTHDKSSVDTNKE